MTNIINDTPDRWMERLRKGNIVWLVKEQKEAQVVFPYEPPEPGYKTGTIGIRSGLLDSWFSDIEGKGIDGSQILLPIEGNLPENPEPLPDVEVRHIHRALERITNRLDSMENRLASLESNNYKDNVEFPEFETVYI